MRMGRAGAGWTNGSGKYRYRTVLSSVQTTRLRVHPTETVRAFCNWVEVAATRRFKRRNSALASSTDRFKWAVSAIESRAGASDVARVWNASAVRTTRSPDPLSVGAAHSPRCALVYQTCAP